MFADLPVEIIHLIARWLAQGDLVSLSLTSSHYYSAVHAKLYELVVVDSSKRLFEEFGDGKTRHLWFSTRSFPGEPTVIRSLYALTKFFKNLALHPEYGHYVRFLVVEDQFPDMPELELARHLSLVLPTLTNLQTLNWYAVHRPLDARLVDLLPRKEFMESIRGNFRFSSSQIVSGSAIYPCLRELDLSNVTSHKALCSIDLDQFPGLDLLTVSKKPSSNMLHFTSRISSCCQSALSNATESLPFSEQPSYISCLFSQPLATKLQLSALALKDISLCAKDAYLLLENIDIPLLQKLSLDNCGEALFDSDMYLDNIPIRRRTPPSELFLDVLAEELTNVDSLNLNLSNELCYNRSTFQAISKMSKLKHLGIHIKVFKTNDPINLAPLVDSLQSHCDTLEYLNMCCDVVETSVSVCPKKNNRYSLKSVIGLSNLRELKVLKLPISFSQIADVTNVLSTLQSLRLLQLGITDLACTASKAACSPCNDTLIYALYNTNCLISQDYFNCPSSFTSKIEQNKTQEYIGYSKMFKSVFQQLQYLRFDLRNQSLLYDCRDAFNIAAKDAGLIDSFDSLVQKYV